MKSQKRWVTLEEETDDQLAEFAKKEKRSIANTLSLIITNFFTNEKK